MKVSGKHLARLGGASAVVLAISISLSLDVVGSQTSSGAFEIKTLSTDPSRVTGGDVLVQISVPDAARAGLNVMVNGRDVREVFQPAPEAHTMIGLVTGLVNGKNTLTVSAKRAGTADASLDITNYPITGPVFSGPWLKPFLCQTDVFKLPDGTALGAPLDENCSARTIVQYVYRSSGPDLNFKPLPTGGGLPSDVAKTTTTDGATVNFIVRVETGTMNRGIYQNTILFDPTIDAPPTPLTPPRGWNRRLIAIHGAGCPGGWYVQGPNMGSSPLNAERLGAGYALFVNTLNHPNNSCNAVVAGETTMMGKEHFIEEFGVPLYTMSTGGSGGAFTSLQIADAYPGLIDGVLVNATFPDTLSIALSGIDAHLLMHYFTEHPTALTNDQKVAISGYASMQALIDAAMQSQRTDPVQDRADMDGYLSAWWPGFEGAYVIPEALRYDPKRNPKGARPTIFDVARNIYGVNPATGAARRPFDNVGVQYGLGALNSGVIAPEQFVALNEAIGGMDDDDNYIRARTAGDLGAIKRAYESDLSLTGQGGLASIPVFDNGTTNEYAGHHYGWFHFAVRERLQQANGRADNMVIWRNTTAAAAQAVFDKWMVAYRSDTSNDPQLVKVLRNKPQEAVEGCYDKSTPPQFIAESLVFTSKPTTKCSDLFPVYSNPRHEAGGPLAANVLKCQSKPIDAKDYAVKLSAGEMTRLKAIFPRGVCDWSKPGVNQVPLVPWASWGPGA
jgi:hypothetical protein